MQELIVVLAWCSVTHRVLMCGDSICTFLRVMVISVTSHDCIAERFCGTCNHLVQTVWKVTFLHTR